MNSDDLADRLLEEPHEKWPPHLRSLRETNVRLPETTRALLKREVKKAKAAQARRTWLVRSAALLLLGCGVAIGSWMYFGRGTGMESVAVLHARGGGIQIAGSPERSPKVLPLGQSIVLGPGSSLLLAFGPLSIEARGPANFRIERKDASGFSFAAQSPSAFVAFAPPGDPHVAIEWQFSATRIELTGTMLSASSTSDRRLKVSILEGAVNLEETRSDGSAISRKLSAGQAFERPADGPGHAYSLPPKERDHLQKLQQRLQDLRAGKPVIDAEVRLESERAIAAHYGALHLVTLKDGRDYRGYAIRGERQVTLHTPSSVFVLDSGSVSSITPTKPETESEE